MEPSTPKSEADSIGCLDVAGCLGCSFVVLFAGILAGGLLVAALGAARVEMTEDGAAYLALAVGGLCVVGFWLSAFFDNDRLLGAVGLVVGTGLMLAGVLAWPLLVVGAVAIWASWLMVTGMDA